MFGIPGKQAVSITDKAATQIAKLMAKDGSEGLRIGVKKGGCAGMEYTMEYVSEINPLDEVVETSGARVMIAPMRKCSSLARKLTTRPRCWNQASNSATRTSSTPAVAASRSNSTMPSPRQSEQHLRRRHCLRDRPALGSRPYYKP